MRRIFACTFAALTLALGAGASTTSAQTTQNGLVNISLNNVTVQVPIGLAANVCDVNVAALLALIVDSDTTTCMAGAESIAQNVQVGAAPDGATTQNGLINVALENVTVQVPIAVALNICDVDVAILAVLVDGDQATCTADASSNAGHGPG
jgi:hypothetical protein